MLDIVAFTNHIIHNSQFCNNGRDYAFYDWVELVETASACGWSLWNWRLTNTKKADWETPVEEDHA